MEKCLPLTCKPAEKQEIDFYEYITISALLFYLLYRTVLGPNQSRPLNIEALCRHLRRIDIH